MHVEQVQLKDVFQAVSAAAFDMLDVNEIDSFNAADVNEIDSFNAAIEYIKAISSPEKLREQFQQGATMLYLPMLAETLEEHNKPQDMVIVIMNNETPYLALTYNDLNY